MSHPTVHPELAKIAESLRMTLASISLKAQETTAVITNYQLEALEWLTEDELADEPAEQADEETETPSPRG